MAITEGDTASTSSSISSSEWSVPLAPVGAIARIDWIASNYCGSAPSAPISPAAPTQSVHCLSTSAWQVSLSLSIFASDSSL